MLSRTGWFTSAVLVGPRTVHHTAPKMPRCSLAVLVNVVAPYRIPVYRALGQSFETTIYVSGDEANRANWRGAEEGLTGVRVRHSTGVTFARQKRSPGAAVDQGYLHLTPGVLVDLLRDRPEAVITTEMGFRTLAALLFGTLAKRPVWVWWGGTPHTERAAGLPKRWVRSLIARWTRRWISYGETSTEYLASLGIARPRILQIQNCVDEAIFKSPGEAWMSLDPKPVLLCPGRLVKLKGLDLLLASAARLQKAGRSFSLLMVGDGPEEASLRRLALDLGVANVHFRPARPPKLMGPVYRSADCVVFPSLSDVWGLVVNEALWSGVPVLSSVYAGCTPEIVPLQNRFDPLDPGDFDRGLTLAVEGRLAPADTSPLKTCAEVSGMIARDILDTLTASAAAA